MLNPATVEKMQAILDNIEEEFFSNEAERMSSKTTPEMAGSMLAALGIALLADEDKQNEEDFEVTEENLPLIFDAMVSKIQKIKAELCGEGSNVVVKTV